MNNNTKPTGIKKLWAAFGFSLQGIKACYQSEYAFRLEVALAIVLVPLGYWLGESEVEKVLLIVPIFLVLIVEMLNSAIEALVDRISLEQHELSGFAKDVASAAVLLSLVIFLLTWTIILQSRFILNVEQMFYFL
jgi:diacylglycerol kinase (ATP)